jgi:transposase
MQSGLFVRVLSETEEYRLKRQVRGRDLYAVRRAQIILASARGIGVQAISPQVGYSEAMIRNVIHAFNQRGLEGLVKGSNRPKTAAPLLGEEQCQRLQHLLHQSPRTFDKNSSLWTLVLLAEVAYEQGLTPHVVSDETIRRALKRLEVKWKRAKHWITSPDPNYERKKSGGNV